MDSKPIYRQKFEIPKMGVFYKYNPIIAIWKASDILNCLERDNIDSFQTNSYNSFRDKTTWIHEAIETIMSPW